MDTSLFAFPPGDSNKRTPMEKDGSDDDEGPTKRPNLGMETGDKSLTVRLLVSNSTAGSIIGKGGESITEFQDQSQSRIQISKSKNYFPQTQERMLLITGTVKAILTALHLMLSKFQTEDSLSGFLVDGSLPLKLCMPNSCCGAIIGKGGSTIQEFQNDSGASIKVQSQDARPAGVDDRTVTVSGSVDQQLRAVALVLAKVAEGSNYNIPQAFPPYLSSGGSMGAPILGGGLPGMPGAPSLPGMMGVPGMMGLHSAPAPAAALPGMPGMALPQAPAVQPGGIQVISPHTLPAAMPAVEEATVTVAVPDEYVGAVVGKGGRTVTEMQAVTGVRIKISARDDFMEGTKNRKVMLIGSLDRIKMAQNLITQKVQEEAAAIQARSMRPADVM
jgi:RNA-binding protein Nova